MSVGPPPPNSLCTASAAWKIREDAAVGLKPVSEHGSKRLVRILDDPPRYLNTALLLRLLGDGDAGVSRAAAYAIADHLDDYPQSKLLVPLRGASRAAVVERQSRSDEHLALAWHAKAVGFDEILPRLGSASSPLLVHALVDSASTPAQLQRLVAAGASSDSAMITSTFDVVPGETYVEFPYDWRRDNRVAARRLQRLVEEKPAIFMAMGNTAEVVARRYQVTREKQDVYALQSQQRYAKAQQAGYSVVADPDKPGRFRFRSPDGVVSDIYADFLRHLQRREDAVQSFRRKAEGAGNLQSDEKQVVVVETGGRPLVVGGDVAVWFGEFDEPPHTEGQLRVRARPGREMLATGTLTVDGETVKVAEGTPIAEVVAQLQGVLQGTPPPWLRKALMKGQARSFDFDDEVK